ncbi:MAG: DUF494 family protein [Calditrichaeota bacterium]|nr:MAG: DUF494 family protein [Calditrichota bacterium]
MQQRVIEIIEILLREISRLQDAPSSQLEQLSEKLLEKGYTEPEIRTAVDWLLLQFEGRSERSGRGRRHSRSPGIRLLSRDEQALVGPRAYGYLIHLQALGILNPILVDQVIERSFINGLDIDPEEIKNIVARLLIGKPLMGARSGRYFNPGNEEIH